MASRSLGQHRSTSGGLRGRPSERMPAHPRLTVERDPAMRHSRQLRCNQLERSMHALHDECDRLMRENAMLRDRMQGAGQSVQRLDDELARIASGPDAEQDPYVVRASSMRMY